MIDVMAMTSRAEQPRRRVVRRPSAAEQFPFGGAILRRRRIRIVIVADQMQRAMDYVQQQLVVSRPRLPRGRFPGLIRANDNFATQTATLPIARVLKTQYIGDEIVIQKVPIQSPHRPRIDDRHGNIGRRPRSPVDDQPDRLRDRIAIDPAALLVDHIDQDARDRLGRLDPFRVFDAHMVHRVEGFDDAVLNVAELAHRQRTIVELARRDALQRDRSDDRLSRAGPGSRRAQAGTFRSVGQHDDRGLRRLRLRTRISKGRFLKLHVFARLFGGLVVKVLDQGRSMMLLNDFDHASWQSMLASHLGAVLDVGNDHQRAHCGNEVGMFAVVTNLILDKVFGLAHFADIVKVSSDSAEQSIGANDLRRGFGDRRDANAVVVRAGCALNQFAAMDGLRLPTRATGYRSAT